MDARGGNVVGIGDDKGEIFVKCVTVGIGYGDGSDQANGAFVV
ncbi:hypothetical protein BTHERMOSOX_423 [Bathymodiolus thermophilus thioautotrophic gill symbiont]|nr:hypothetical protein BTHERMOSOX_423 [Bathymodiolus thermophilus thioautotrophic gill symbiont]